MRKILSLAAMCAALALAGCAAPGDMDGAGMEENGDPAFLFSSPFGADDGMASPFFDEDGVMGGYGVGLPLSGWGWQ